VTIEHHAATRRTDAAKKARAIVERDRIITNLIARHWQASQDGDGDAEHDIYAPSAILDYPQSGERFRGRETIQAQRGGHPAERRFAVRRISGLADLWVSECVITYDGSPTYSVSIMEFENEHVVHETQYFADPFDAAPRRAYLAERIPEI
jgi:SnoaL-like domain